MDYTKCKLSGGRSPRRLILFIVAAHYTFVDCTHVHHIVHYKIIGTYIPYLVAFVAGRISYSLLQRIGNIAQKNTTNQTADEPNSI